MGSGYIYGRPIVAQGAKPYVIRASNAGGSTTATVMIEVRDPAVQISGLTYSHNPTTYKVTARGSTAQPGTSVQLVIAINGPGSSSG